MSVIFNNPLLIILLVIGIGVMVVFGTKYFEEYGLNKQLRLKQKSMRIKGESISNKKSLLGALALAPAFILVVGLFVASNINTLENTNVLAITSGDDIVDIYERFTGRSEDKSWFRNFAMEESVDLTPTADNDATDGEADYQSGSGSDDYSETNNQVESVDEYDNVVSDGKYIYTMNGGKIQITLAFTQEFGIEGFGKVHEIEFNQEYIDCESTYVYPIGMYVDGERLVVIASENFYYNWECYEQDGKEPYIDYWYGNESNGIKVFVYEKETWEMDDEYTFNGYFTGTRKVGNELYIITNKYLPLYDDSIEVDDFLPYYEVNNQMVSAKYEDIVYNDGTNPNTFTTFYGVNLDTTEVDMEVILGDSGYNLYVSENNMYLVGSVYYFWPEADIATTDSEPSYEPKTAIMKVAIDEGSVDFKAIGYVDGYTLNQFSMDEHNGYLRITTTNGWWGSELNNRLFVLDENLHIVGKLENLGKPGETIRSTRFVGDYGYVVTFEQTDPFYVINLSDPENPVKEGELEIPGFSTYLQPLGNDYMLGIGFDADPDTGWTTGLKIQIYDISDKANPVVFDTITFPYSTFDEMGWSWSWSSVVYNHKDLLLDLDKGIIAFPFSSDFWTEEGGYQYNSGIIVYNIDLETGFSDEFSFVQHSTDAQEYTYVYKAKFIHDTANDITYFYAISNRFMTVHDLADLSPEAELDRTDIYAEYNYYSWGYYDDVVEPEEGEDTDSSEPDPTTEG